MFAWWGHFVYRFRWGVLALSALLLVGSIVALGHGGTLKNSGGSNTESGRALTLMQNQLPQSGAGSSFTLVFGNNTMAPAMASAEASGGWAIPAITPLVMRAMKARRSSMKARTAAAIFGL